MSTKGALRTILWTQLRDALKTDFGIDLPQKSEKKTTTLIDEIVDMIEQ